MGQVCLLMFQAYNPPPLLRNLGYATAQAREEIAIEQYFESRSLENFQNKNEPRLEKGWEPLL